MNVWKYINKKESSASTDTAPEEDFSHIYNAVKEKQEELDILYAEKLVAEIEAAEEKRATDTLNKIKSKISEALGHEATDEQVAEMMQRLK